MFFELIAIIFVCIFLYDYVTKKRRNYMTRNMPGPRALPIIGNALMYMRRNQEDIMKYIVANKNKYGKLYRIWVFNQLAIFSSDPKDVEIVLSSPKYIKKSTLYDFLHTWLGTGLLLSSGQKWHSRRKIITPTFHFKILEEFIEIFDQQSSILVEKLKPSANGEEFNIYPFITLAALDIVSETAMGTKIDAQTGASREYVQAVTDILNVLSMRFINVWHRMDWVFNIFGAENKRKQDNAIKILHLFTENIIEERRNFLESKKDNINQEEEVDQFGRKRKFALLDVLLQSNVNGEPLTNEEIREEVDTFMFEGHDTTTAAIGFALYLISAHPDIQKKIYTEIHDVIGDDKMKPITYRELQELKYLECVIKETLRLYPSVPIIARLFTEDVNLNDKIIPAGTNYTVGIFVMLRDPEIFPNPDEFIPDRHFIENSTEKTNPYAFIPFSAGPRNCIGQKFAMLELKSTISKILRHYELLRCGPEPIPSMNLVLRSSNGVHIGLKPRFY